MSIYYNLTQASGDKVVYFRSTDIEQHNWHRLLWCIPDEWFYKLYLGDNILVIDKTSNHKGKIERIFIPVLVDLLKAMFLDEPPVANHLKDHFQMACQALQDDNSLNTRIMFWKDKIHAINIVGHSVHVEREENPI